MSRPQTIQIYLPQGDPAGIRVASLTTRTVQMFGVPRLLLRDFLAMPQAGQVAVYYLFGPSGDEAPQCYIGQTGSAGERLKQHAKDQSKDFWTTAAVGVSLTNEWTSTHVALLEWMSIDAATKIGRFNLLNGNTATRPHTPSPLEADCYEFYETISVLLSTLGQPLLEPAQRSILNAATPPSPAGASSTRPITATMSEILFFREGGCDSTGVQTPEGLLVQAGSTGRQQVRPSAAPALIAQRAALVRDGVISYADGHLTFLKDFLFSSASGAGSLIVGGSNNGRISWRNAAGKNLNQIEADALDAAQPAPEA